MSSAESFALMFVQCPQVITLGDRTTGSMANPRRIDAGAGLVVNLPRWIDMDPQGKPIDAVGVPPRVKIETRPEDFTGDQDPVLTAALEDVVNRAKSAPAGKVLEPRPGAPPPVDREGRMQMPFLVGSDGRQCWHVYQDRIITCPFETIHEKDTRFCDPFGSTGFVTRRRRSANSGWSISCFVQHEGRSCHRIRSWSLRVLRGVAGAYTTG